VEIHNWVQPNIKDIKQTKKRKVAPQNNGSDWYETITRGGLLALEAGDFRLGT
jgi:pyruvate formate-lyase activating enzyme-like uncharacterized protein